MEITNNHVTNNQGYARKKLALLQPSLTKVVKKKLDELAEDLKNEDLTQVRLIT